MASFSFDPQQTLGSASQGLTGQPIIIGLPTRVNPVPSFVIGVTTEADFAVSSNITSFQIADGDLFMKTARNPGEYSFKLALSETPSLNSTQQRRVIQILQNLGNVASRLVGSGIAGGIQSVAGLSSNYVALQLKQLNAMKDGAQPIYLLNSFISLSSLGAWNGNLMSNWYIESIQGIKGQSQRGTVLRIKVKEIMSRFDPTSPTAIIETIASKLLN